MKVRKHKKMILVFVKCEILLEKILLHDESRFYFFVVLLKKCTIKGVQYFPFYQQYVFRLPSSMSNACRMLPILDLVRLVRLAGCER